MKKQKIIKIVSIALIVILILNLVLFAFSIITGLLFWITILICFAATYLLKKIKMNKYNCIGC